MTDPKPSPSSGNPSPEPSAESRKTATEMHNRECPCLDDAVPPEPNADCVRLIWEFAWALDAAKRSSRREALGQAAKLAGGMYQGGGIGADIASALRALMEAE